MLITGRTYWVADCSADWVGEHHRIFSHYSGGKPYFAFNASSTSFVTWEMYRELTSVPALAAALKNEILAYDILAKYCKDAVEDRSTTLLEANASLRESAMALTIAIERLDS